MLEEKMEQTMVGETLVINKEVDFLKLEKNHSWGTTWNPSFRGGRKINPQTTWKHEKGEWIVILA